MLDARAGELLALPGVVGVAEGERDGRPCVVVLVSALSEELDRRLPRELEGHPVEVRVSGELRPRS